MKTCSNCRFFNRAAYLAQDVYKDEDAHSDKIGICDWVPTKAPPWYSQIEIEVYVDDEGCAAWKGIPKEVKRSKSLPAGMVQLELKRSDSYVNNWYGDIR